jgi:lysophospholipase L1-like esterase
MGGAAVATAVAVAAVALPRTSAFPRHAAFAPRRGDPAVAGAHHVVALGDSVASGAACSCDPFPVLYARLLSQRTGTRVTVENDGVSGLDTGGLVAQLKEPDVADAVRRADVVLVTIGANDFGDRHDQVVGGTCTGAGGADCVSDELATLRSRLAGALVAIRTLRQGRPTSVLVTGYWNVFEDGQVARRSFGASGLRAALDLTRRVNATIRAVSATSRAHYVDLFEPFESRGPDIDALLASDGDHPDAAGHRLIATTLVDAGLPHGSP